MECLANICIKIIESHCRNIELLNWLTTLQDFHNKNQHLLKLLEMLIASILKI